MWTVIYMVQSSDAANQLRNLLEAADILVKIRPVTRVAEGETNAFEILVPQTEKDTAHKIIIESGF